MFYIISVSFVANELFLISHINGPKILKSVFWPFNMDFNLCYKQSSLKFGTLCISIRRSLLVLLNHFRQNWIILHQKLLYLEYFNHMSIMEKKLGQFWCNLNHFVIFTTLIHFAPKLTLGLIWWPISHQHTTINWLGINIKWRNCT